MLARSVRQSGRLAAIAIGRRCAAATSSGICLNDFFQGGAQIANIFFGEAARSAEVATNLGTAGAARISEAEGDMLAERVVKSAGRAA